MEVPLILTLDSHGVPHRWVSWQQACFYYAKNLVAWTLGNVAFTAYGGMCRATGERSSITAHTIIAIKGKAMAMNGIKRNRTPEESGLQLVYAPYVPNKAEYLILTNRKILADQMELLLQHVSAQSRVFDLTLAPR